MSRTDTARPIPDRTPLDTGATLMDMDHAIRSLATTRPTFYRWLRAGRITGVKIGRQWRFRRDDIERFLRGEGPRIDLPSDIKPLITALQERLGDTVSPPTGDLVMKAAELAIRLALQLKATDLHLAPLARSAAMQIRVDGVLIEIARFDAKLQVLLADCFKGLAAMDLAIRDRAQDGRVTLNVAQQRLELLITCLPTVHGECVVAGLHDQSQGLPTLEAMALATRDRALLQRSLAAGSGLLVFTGPTGSGKTITLYACAGIAATPEVRLVSIERHAPFDLPQAVHVHVSPEAGMGYAACLRAALRIDPDIIVVDELRDHDALEAATECSLTGHLVLTSHHAPDALSALRQLAAPGHGHDAIVDEISLVLAQRLVRRLCRTCALSSPMSATDQRRVEAVLCKTLPAKPRTMRAPGCPACRSTGFQGRVMICEMLEVSRELRAALRDAATDQELRRIALSQGFTGLACDGVRKALDGLTTLEEVWRCAPLTDRPA